MKFKWQTFLIAIGLFIAVVLLIDFNRRMEQLNSLNSKLASVHAEGTSIMKTQAALVTQVAYATSNAAVEQWAYQNKWVRVGEHPIQLMPEGSPSATPQPPPTTVNVSTPNWRIWWELFFGTN